VFYHIKKAYDRKKYGTMQNIFWVMYGLVNYLMAQYTNNSAPQGPAMPLSTQSSTYPPNGGNHYHSLMYNLFHKVQNIEKLTNR